MVSWLRLASCTASPADAILLVDAAPVPRRGRRVVSCPCAPVLEDAIPANLRATPAADGGIAWFGLSTRARVIVCQQGQGE